MGKLFFVLLIGLFLFTAGCMQPGPGGNNTTITTDSKPATMVPTYGENSWVPEPVGLSTSYPEFPRTMMVYRVIPEDPGEKIGELSGKFNISGDLKMYDNSWIIREYNSTNQERHELSIDLGSGYFE